MDRIWGCLAGGRTKPPTWLSSKPPGYAPPLFLYLALFSAAQAVREVLRTLKRENSLTPVRTISFRSMITTTVGLKALLAREESYDRAAASLVHKRAAEWARMNSQLLIRGIEKPQARCFETRTRALLRCGPRLRSERSSASKHRPPRAWHRPVARGTRRSGPGMTQK